MITNHFRNLGLSVLLIIPVLADAADALQTTAAPPGSEASASVKVETIRIEDQQGVIEEQRVAAMRSEIRYVPTGSADGYNLVNATESQGKSQNTHQNSNMLIPSWQVFAW
ncbi:MAG: hypothetical protein ACK4RS_02035 [Thiothrix sp.]